MDGTLMEIVARASVVFVFLIVLTRVLGKRELSEMSPFDVVLLVIMGDLVQQAITSDDRSLTSAFLAIGTIAVWILAMSYGTFRSARLRRLVDGRPTLVVRDGSVIDEALRIERIPMDELLEAARGKGIGDLSHVRVGILESDGSFSFIRYDADERAEHG
ncbi:MAG TPA: YetF domain-containing protein [Acidimicrobiia bacterium]